MPNARVSAFTRWNNAVVESRKSAIDYLALDLFRQEVLSQEELYENSVRPFVNRCLQGCSGSIITYGAWGSGKSYTLGTLDPQQLTLDSSGNETTGVLHRCTQQLYECLGPVAAVEITCVEVQGDEVVDLLGQRTGPAAFGRLTNAEGPHVVASSICSSSGIPGPAGVPLAAPGAFTRSPIAVTAASAGSGSGSRRKPLTLVVARSLTEALLTLKQAVANRQAFVTATRHSSSRTHAVFQLRWRSPATPAAGGGVASTAARPAGRVSGGGAAQRAYSAPPRASLSTGPAVCPALAAAAGGRAPAAGAAAGPVCTLTLVDTCSFCPLLPPKEGSAVKRSLLALSRVLSGLQRRHALTLRESKLTRMLEGAVDQVLVLACLGGSGDEPTVQLVKMLQQGVSRDNALRRSRRASSSDSTRESGAWEPHTSVFSVSAVRLGSGGAAGTPPLPRANATAAKCTMGGTAAGSRLGPVPDLSIFRSPGSPSPGCNLENKARPAPTVRTDCPAQDSVEARGVEADGDETAGGGSSNTSSGGGTGTDADAVPAPQLSSSSLEVSSTSPAASSRSADDCGVEAAAAASTAAALTSAKAARPAPLTIDVHTDSTDALATADVCSDVPGFHVISDGGGAVASAAAAAAHEKRLALSSGGGNTGGRRAGSSIPSPPGSAAGTPLPRRMSPRLYSPRQKPPSVTARAAPSPEVRRSQGFSVLAGKWASPPPASPRDRSFPVLPCILTPRDGASAAATSSQRSSVEPPAPAATSTGSAGSLAASERLTRGSVGARPTSRAPSAPLPSGPVARSPASKPNRGGRDADAKTPRSGGCAGAVGAGVGGFISPFAIAEHQPEGHAVVTSTVDPPEQTCAGPSARPAPIGSTLARRKPSIPGRPPVRSPQPSPFAAAVAAAAGSASPRPGARSPSPSAAATVVSLTAVRPTRLASMRYGSANISHDSVLDGSAGPAAAACSAVTPVSPVRMPLRRGQSSAVAAPTASVSPGGTGDPDGIAVRRAREAPGGTLAALKRSVSSGLRWPSPLLRARRAEWLSDLRRSRSAFPRPVSEVPEPEGGSGASPRRLRHGGFRCAVMGRPTLSAQYKDLLLDFEAFKARERPPRKHRSALGEAAPLMPSAATAPLPSTMAMAAIGTLGTISPERLGARDAKAATAAPDLLAPVLSPKQGSPMPARRGSAASALATVPSSPRPGTPATSAPPGSPVVSTGLPGASSPASISTPHSARPASGSCARPPSAFSRAHSPSAEEGLISLTAAAAVAAASPRTPASGSALPSGRPRPGVSRAAGTAASPRPLRSSENATTTVSPVTVLDMSRLFATKGSPSAAAVGTTAPGSGRSRISASSVNAAAAGGPLASGGSDRYRRLAEEDADSDIASAAGPDADPGPGSVRSHSDADPSVGSDSDQDNLLGPGCLGHLGLMLDTGGDVAALRNSLNLLTDSGRASPAIGAVAAAATPSPLRRVAVADAEDAVASAGAAALYSWPSEGGVEGPDEELPAVSFFICQFTPRPEFRDGDGDRAAAEEHRPSAAAGEAQCAATISADADAVPPPAGTEATAHNDTPHAKKDAAEVVVGRTGVPQTEPLPEPEQQQEELTQPRQRRSPMRQAAAGICASAVAAAAAAAVAELQLPYTSQDRASVESGVLRGSCTPFAVDSEVTAAPGGHAAAPPTVAVQPEPGGQEREREAEPRAEEQGLGHRNRAPGSRGAAGPQETTEGTALGPPSESSISLRQLLERQELLLLQQRLTRRPGGLGAAVAPAGQMEQGQGQRRPGGSGGVSAATLAANARLAQLARVRPNHSDLDEQSNVLVDVDSTSESEVAAAVDAARRTVTSLAQQCGRPSAPAGSPAAAVLVNAARPLRPSAAPPEPPAAVRTPSPIKPSPSASPSQLPAQSSSVRSRVAALEAAISPVAARTSASSTPPHLMQSWAHGGGVGGHSSPAAATAAAGAQGGSADGARRGLAQARSSPSPGAVPSVKPTADKGRKALSGSSPVPQRRAVPANGGAGHARHPSDGAIGAGGVLAALRWGTLGRTAAAAPAVASPPPSPPPRLTRSTDSQGAARLRTSPSLSSPPPPPPLAQQSQQHHCQQQPAAQQQQPLRGSGNVAAAWRAAAAMSTSSSSSVRSCFRSSSGQPQQNSMIGSDATAVATVVALGRAPPSSCDDKHDAALAGNSDQSAATAAAAAVKLSGGVERSNSTRNSGSNTVAVKLSGGVERSDSTRNSGSNTAAVKLSGGVERSNSTRNSGNNTASAAKLCGGVERSDSTRNSGSNTASATAAAAKLCGGMERSQSTRSSGSAAAAPVAPTAAAITPPLPPNASAAPNTVAMRSAPPGPTTVPYVPPLALPPQPTAAADAGRAAPPSSTLTKAKSARSERSFPLTARLRACKSHRTPRAAGSSAVAGEAAGAGLEEVAEQPPPPAYPPGFVTWATRLFSGSRKKKQQPS